MKLSDYFPTSQILNDGVFSTLGGIRSECKSTLAYTDTLLHLKKLSNTKNISCLIVNKKFADELKDNELGLVISSSPRDRFFDLHEMLIKENHYPLMTKPYRGECCNIHPSSVLADNIFIGDNVTIGEHAVIRDNTHISSGVLIEPGVIVGADGILYRLEQNKKRFVDRFIPTYC